MKREEIARRRYLRYLLLYIALVCLVTFTGALNLRSNLGVDSTAAAAAKTERVTISIEGMSCTSCASGIKAVLKRTPGVIAAEVSFERREAVVDYDSDKTSREKIVEAVTKLGYRATVKS